MADSGRRQSAKLIIFSAPTLHFDLRDKEVNEMSRKVFGGAIVLALGMSGALAAQSTSPPAAQQPATTGQAATAQPVTVEGCLVREQAVPGREPNVAERAGVMEDYILTSVKFVKGHPHASAPTGTSGATGAAGTAAGETAGTSGIAKADTKLEIRGIDDEQLQQFIGQRVQIEGRVDPSDFAERAREKATGEKSGDLPELHGTVIRKSSSTEPCPSK